jgi:hypothetical protein
MKGYDKMRNLTKYHGIIPAFYACYNDDGSVSPERTKAFAKFLLDKGVKGLYVCGSSGECIYQSKEERKLILESRQKIDLCKNCDNFGVEDPNDWLKGYSIGNNWDAIEKLV